MSVDIGSGREATVQRSVGLTREQWEWLRRESIRDQSLSVSAVIRRLVEQARTTEEVRAA